MTHIDRYTKGISNILYGIVTVDYFRKNKQTKKPSTFCISVTHFVFTDFCMNANVCMNASPTFSRRMVVFSSVLHLQEKHKLPGGRSASSDARRDQPIRSEQRRPWPRLSGLCSRTTAYGRTRTGRRGSTTFLRK